MLIQKCVPCLSTFSQPARTHELLQLLQRFYAQLHASNPALLTSSGKRYTIAPPQLAREGNKKTIFVNVSDICKRMHRPPEHVIQYMFAEMGTTGSVDGSGRLVIRGRFQQKQIEHVLRRYIGTYFFQRWPSPYPDLLVPVCSGIRHMQNMQIARHPSYQRKPYLLYGLRVLWVKAFRKRDQDWFPSTSRKEEQEQDWLNSLLVPCFPRSLTFICYPKSEQVFLGSSMFVFLLQSIDDTTMRYSTILISVVFTLLARLVLFGRIYWTSRWCKTLF